MAKKASEFTSQVVPKSRLKLVRLRVLSSRKATPSTKKCGLKRRTVVPVSARRTGHRHERAEEHDAPARPGSAGR